MITSHRRGGGPVRSAVAQAREHLAALIETAEAGPRRPSDDSPATPTIAASTTAWPANGIFLSYRRHDNAAAAGRLSDRLQVRCGPGTVFMDVESIVAGQNYRDIILEAAGSCRVLVALIGEQWYAVEEDGRPRLENPRDYVRLEIAIALRRGIPVIPVLWGTAQLPPTVRLPEEIAALTSKHHIPLRHSSFAADAAALAAAIERIAPHEIPPAR